MNPNHPFDLVIGLDRSDQKADLFLIHTRLGTTAARTISTAPEALHDWLFQLRQEHPGARVALCVEQPAASAGSTHAALGLNAPRAILF